MIFLAQVMAHQISTPIHKEKQELTHVPVHLIPTPYITPYMDMIALCVSLRPSISPSLCSISWSTGGQKLKLKLCIGAQGSKT